MFGGIATGLSFGVIVVQNPLTRWVGLGWMAAGLAGYAALPTPLGAGLARGRHQGAAGVRGGARARLSPASWFRSFPDVPPTTRSTWRAGSRRSGARGWSRSPSSRCPLELPLDAPLPHEERIANDELDEAVAIGDTYGVRVVGRLVRGRSASAEIVREAERRGTEIIVLGSPRKSLVSRRRGVFGTTVDRVMRKAPCRVMVATAREAAA